jgi:UDP-N-acetylmuramoylalanine--D-glutamate ligase
MIRVSTFAGRKVAVVGLGASGRATALALAAGGAEVAAWDDGAAAREAAAQAGIPIRDLARADWSDFAALVLAPGVPLTHPSPHWTAMRAHAAGVEIIGDIELFFRERASLSPQAPVIAITGTNGISTTTALIAHLLESVGLPVAMGGNIGVPALALSPFADPAHASEGLLPVYVIEMSSFQIDLTPSLKPTVGVLLNITPDHLDRHGPADDPGIAMGNYAAIKERLVAAAEIACIGADGQTTRAILERQRASGHSVLSFAAEPEFAPVSDLYAVGTRLYCRDRESGAVQDREIADTQGCGTLRGTHNVQNALAALAGVRGLARWLGRRRASLDVWKPQTLAAALHTYPGLAHRMEEVGRCGRVLFVNDSKATNADSAEKALAAFDRDIHWILGGKAKEGGIRSLRPYFSRVAKAYLIGEASDAFADTLAGLVAFERCGTLDAAVAAAARDAATSSGNEPVVLLSPACASYDQFKSFEHRGACFRELVGRLPGVSLRSRDAR